MRTDGAVLVLCTVSGVQVSSPVMVYSGVPADCVVSCART